MSDVDGASAGREQGDLAGLLEAWRHQPAVELAEAIAALAPPAARPPLELAGAGAAQSQRWNEHAAAQRPEELDGLLASWFEVPTEPAALRAEALARWPADPRRDQALLAVLERIPGKTSRKLWGRLLKLVELVRDPRALPRLQALDALYAAHFRSQVGEWVRGKLAVALTRLAPALEQAAREPLAPELVEAIARLRRGGAPRPGAGAQRRAESEEELLQRILDDPGDDDARQVYGDLLAERGHPRGELIALQYLKRRQKLTAAQAQREKALIRDHLPELVGPLAQVLFRSGLELERGFLARAAVDDSKGHLLPGVVGHPLWSTVVELTGPPVIFQHPVLRALERLHVPREPLTSALWEGERALPGVTALWCCVKSVDDARGLGGSALLPALRELHLCSFNTYWVAPHVFLETPLAGRLQRLDVELPWDWLPWLQALQRPCAIPRVALAWKAHLVFELERDTRGRHTRLTARLALPARGRGEAEEDAVDLLLTQLGKIAPAQLTALSIQPSRPLSAGAAQRLRQGLARFDEIAECHYP